MAAPIQVVEGRKGQVAGVGHSVVESAPACVFAEFPTQRWGVLKGRLHDCIFRHTPPMSEE